MVSSALIPHSTSPRLTSQTYTPITPHLQQLHLTYRNPLSIHIHTHLPPKPNPNPVAEPTIFPLVARLNVPPRIFTHSPISYSSSFADSDPIQFPPIPSTLSSIKIYIHMYTPCRKKNYWNISDFPLLPLLLVASDVPCCAALRSKRGKGRKKKKPDRNCAQSSSTPHFVPIRSSPHHLIPAYPRITTTHPQTFFFHLFFFSLPPYRTSDSSLPAACLHSYLPNYIQIFKFSALSLSTDAYLHPIANPRIQHSRTQPPYLGQNLYLLPLMEMNISLSRSKKTTSTKSHFPLPVELDLVSFHSTRSPSLISPSSLSSPSASNVKYTTAPQPTQEHFTSSL